MDKQLTIAARGGTCFGVAITGSDGDGLFRNFLGHMEFGTLDGDGQYMESDEEIIAAAREAFGVSDDIPAKVV